MSLFRRNAAQVCRANVVFTIRNLLFAIKPITVAKVAYSSTFKSSLAELTENMLNHLEIKYVRSSGPGGQNVNKLDTKVQIKFEVLTATWLTNPGKKRLLDTHKNNISKEGFFTLECQKFRSQQQNLNEAMKNLHKIVSVANETSYNPSKYTLLERKSQKCKSVMDKRKKLKSQLIADIKQKQNKPN